MDAVHTLRLLGLDGETERYNIDSDIESTIMTPVPVASSDRVDVAAFVKKLERNKSSPILPSSSRSSAPPSSLPVWKQRQLRNHQQNGHSFNRHRPLSKTFATPVKTPRSGNIVPPETPFSSRHQSSVSLSTPPSKFTSSTPPTVSPSPSPGGRSPASQSTSERDNTFGFFKATSPKASEKPKVITPEQRQPPVNIYTRSDSTHDTYVSSSSSEDEGSPPRPQSLSSAWEQKITRQKQELSSRVLKGSSLIVDTREEEETTSSANSSPLKVTAKTDMQVAAQWQQRIREKHGKNSQRVIPTSPNTSKRIFAAANAMGAQDSIKTKVERDVLAVPDLGQASINSNQSKGPLLDTHETKPVTTTEVHPETNMDVSLEIVPFHATQTTTEKDSQLALIPDEELNFENILDSLAQPNESYQHDAAYAEEFHVNLSHDDLMNLIRDCEERWTNSSKLSAVVRPSPLTFLLPSSEHHDQAQVIRSQQSEIAELRAKIAAREFTSVVYKEEEPVLALEVSVPSVSLAQASGATSVEPPLEYIDSVPLEHIEVANTMDFDLCSVTSGLTNLNDLGRIADEPSLAAGASFADPFVLYENSGTSPSQRSSPGRGRIVRRVSLNLQAGDGSNRKAWYTGPVVNEDEYTGFGKYGILSKVVQIMAGTWFSFNHFSNSSQDTWKCPMETRTREKCWTEICMAKANTPTGGSPARAKIDSTKSSGGISRTMFSVRIFSPFGFVPPSLVLCPFLSSHCFHFFPAGWDTTS